MRKHIFTLTVSFFLLAGYSLAQTFTINGKIDGVKAGKAELQFRDTSGKMVPKYSTGIAEDGTFVLKGKVTEPDLYSLRIDDLKGAVALFLDNSVITVTGKSDNLMGSEIKGSATHDQYTRYLQLIRSQSEQLRPLYASMSEADKAGKKEETKKLEAQMDELDAKQIAEKIALAKELGASPVAAYIAVMNAYNPDNQPQLEAVLAKLGPGLVDYRYTKTLTERIEKFKLTAIGTIAPDFTQNDADGKPVKLSDFRGKYVLIDFWASWCGPCRRENPNVVKAYQKFKNKSFTILGVSLDRDKDKWLKAIQDDNLTWNHVSDLQYWNNEVAVKYGVKSIPANFLIDKTGKVIGRNLKGDDLEKALAKAIK